MKKFYIKENRKIYEVHQLMDGVDLFKIEENDCIYEVFRSRAGEWKLLYRLPGSRELPLASLAQRLDIEIFGFQKPESKN